jgi:hypothetical protein
VHKVGRTPTNRVVERRNMIKCSLGGEFALRVLGEFVSGGVLILRFSLPFFGLPFVGITVFPSSR